MKTHKMTPTKHLIDSSLLDQREERQNIDKFLEHNVLSYDQLTTYLGQSLDEVMC